MKPKLLFWIDQALLHYGLAKFIQENLDCKMYSIFEVTENAKKFFNNQNIVNFEKSWFFHDNILKGSSDLDLDYLEKMEKKYNLDLQLIAFNDRIFYNFNSYYKFSRNEILRILQDEIRFFESVLDEIEPDFLIIFETHQQHNHIFYEICKARGIEIIIPVGSRIGIKLHPKYWGKFCIPFKIKANPVTLVDFSGFTVCPSIVPASRSKAIAPSLDSIWINAIGRKTREKINPEIITSVIFNFRLFFLTKNIIRNVNKIKIPSALTIVENPIITNEMYTIFLFSFKYNRKLITTNRMYNESLIPNKEFCIKCGSKPNNNAPSKL